FAPAKAAQRVLAQSMARSLGPRGIHVAYVIVDGVIDIPNTRAFLGDRPDDFFLKPDAIAETFWQLARQDRSAWTFELDVRPFGGGGEGGDPVGAEPGSAGSRTCAAAAGEARGTWCPPGVDSDSRPGLDCRLACSGPAPRRPCWSRRTRRRPGSHGGSSR